MPLNYTQNLKFRPQREERLDEFQFTGGLYTDAHETKLEPNQASDLSNVTFNETGSIKTRNGYLRYNGLPVGAATDEANTGSSTGTLALDATSDFVAQTFTVGTTTAIAQIDFYLEMNTAGEEQLVQAQLWSTSGSAPSAVLSTAQIKNVSGDSETAYSFRFRVHEPLTSGTTYAIVLKPYLNVDDATVNQVNVHHTGTAYANGNVYTSTDSGLNWTSDTNKDLKFEVFTGGDTGGTGLIRYYGTAGTQQLFAKFNDTLYRGNDQTGAMTTITFPSGVVLDSDNFIDWAIVDNALLIIDGENFIKKYRGSTNANYTTGTVSVTEGSATVTGSSTVWNTSTNATSGEYIKLPDGKWYKITAIGSDTSLTIETEYLGSTASGQTYVISPWGEVQGKLSSASAPASLIRPTPNSIASHVNRVWVSEDNTLRFSALDTSIDDEHFNDWDTANNAGSIIIPAGKGDKITGLYSLNNSLYVFQRRSIWRVYGTSPANFEVRNVTNEIGMIDKRTLVEWNDVLIFLSDFGIIMFDGSNIENISEGRVNSFIDGWANKTSPIATLWGNRYILSYTPSGETSNTEALYYDLTRGIFGKFKNLHASAWSVWRGGTDAGEVYFTSSNQGSIYKWDTGTHDDGYEIESFYATGSLGFDAGANDKTIKRVFLQQLAKGNFNMTAKMFSDINADEASEDINLGETTTSLWDVAQWDVDVWSTEGSIITTRVGEFQGAAKYHKFRFEQTGYSQGMDILGLTVTARKRRLT